MKNIFSIIALVISISISGQENTTLNFEDLNLLFNTKQYDSIVSLKSGLLIKQDPSKKADILFIYAKTYEALNKDDKALEYYKRSKVYFKNGNYLEKVAQINGIIFNLLDAKKEDKLDKSKYLKEIKAFALESKSKKWLMNYYNLKGIENFNSQHKDSSKIYFKKAKTIANSIDSLKAIIDLDTNIGALFLVEYQAPDSAIYYYEKALKGYQSSKLKDNRNLFALYNNIGNAYREKQQYNKAIDYYKKAEYIELKAFNRQSKQILFSNMDVTYYYMGDFENAYTYFYKYDSINQLLNNKEQVKNIADIEEKYQNEKLRADNLEIEAENTRSKNLAIGLGGSLLLGSVIVFLVYKNNKRKQALILQDKELKEKVLTTKLKEQELASINAMIEGQEKERLRIANDLHDDLGSHMATIKMYFSSFKDQDSKNLYGKTNALIEEAYQKIRNIAHAKNSGVLAKQGLLIAVKNLAGNISKSEKVEVKVYDNGLDQRLENSLELTLFRIIQELITNVIKHANATEVDVHLSEDDGMLNIMVEDDGSGFDTSQVLKNNKGIGLSSIDRRIEDLNGKMIIESQPNSGTSIIIDLPL